ncbi:hypothetical protein EDB81DRAFT_849108 [Dactylonectria macrodidyma]|uniref:Uncharacterized protein n=1 Tax=Dactylonectria macrodidyma TaxID=307937 RepID=A0A9P9D0W8_9HYPO|nr:hypothetical protein EDB81DRAFT_849108 [Dactylonectria macrodidyma]
MSLNWSNSSQIHTPQRYDAGSLSDDESNGDLESSEDEYEDFEESEREDGLDDWMSDLTSQDTTDDSQLHESLGHEARNGPVAVSIDEFLELLFQLSFALSTEAFINGQPSTALLVYFSGILGFSSDCRRFQLAREYCLCLSGLIWIQRFILLEYALPLYSYPIIGIHRRPHMPMQRLNDARQKYMVSGSLSLLAELHSLRNFGQKPNLDISKSKDDLTNTPPGLSFVIHLDNSFESMYKDLLVQAYTSHYVSS